MSKTKYVALTLMIFVAAIVVYIFVFDKKEKAGGPYYFRTWTGYHMPPTPIDQITREAAEKLKVYYVVHYNDIGAVSSIAKYMDGIEQYSATYHYNEAGNLEAEEITNLDGSRSKKTFK